MKRTMVNFLLQFSGRTNSQRYKIVSLMVGALFFLAVLPGIFIGIGLFIRQHITINAGRTIELTVSAAGITAGLFFLVWSTVTQWKTGNGTPAPHAPTQHLIISGPYKYCRNPIEFGAILYYLGVGTLLGGITVGITGFVLGFAAGSIYHKCIEEKELEERFGEAYRKYKEQTPFLFPGIKRGKHDNGPVR